MTISLENWANSYVKKVIDSRKHKVFISYHHENDQDYKDNLVSLLENWAISIDRSVGDGDISDDCKDETIRQKIRDEYLRDSTVTILLVGIETKKRKFVDWELYSSMYDGNVNKQSGILVIMLPSTKCTVPLLSNENEKMEIYPEITNWIGEYSQTELVEIYNHYMPDRIIDNLLTGECRISVVPWKKINKSSLKLLIQNAYDNRITNKYDLRRKMMGR